MTNNVINQQFLAVVDAGTRTVILTAVAQHYGITEAAALEEVTQDEAEHLLDYLTGPVRTAASLSMRMHGFAH